MKKTNKKRALIASIAAFALVAGTYAMYVSNFKVENKFQVTAPDAKFEETFTPPLEGDTVFGNSYAKSGKVINDSNFPVKARVKIEAKWVDTTSEGRDISNLFKKNDTDYAFAATLNFGNTDTAKVALGEFKNETAPTGSLSADVNKDYGTKGGSTETSGTDLWIYDDADKCFYYGGKTGGFVPKNDSSSTILESVDFDGALGVADRKTALYTLSDDEAQGNSVADPTYKAEGYDSQKEATDRIAYLISKGKNPNKTITYTETSTYKKDSDDHSYDGATYIVKLTGQIISADTTWDNAGSFN